MEHNIYYPAVYHLKRNFSIQSFAKFFLNSSQAFGQLQKIIKNCQVDHIYCRFNVWRLCLGVNSIQSSIQQKVNQIKTARQKYQQKKEQALKSAHKKSPLKQPVKKNPLLMMGPIKANQTKQTESDQFLKQQIQKDVQRTYQQMKFFQDKNILKLLSLILFIWCRRNPQVSYKQGMNQLLASVVVCYFKQAQFKKQTEKPQQIPEQLWNYHLFFNSVQYAQSDIYAVFEKIIQIQGDMYKTEGDLNIKTKVNPNSKNNTPILQRIIQIKDHKLKHMDLQLFRIIKLQDVQTKSFMLRWIRCMHTRQFDLQNSFNIWDSIFLQYKESDNSKKNKQFQFIDAMCLAMFMYMRSIVFTKQTAGQILQVYQKYPPLKRGQYLDELITLAWTICQQLRIQGQNTQTSQSNWFQQSQKIQALHFMDKKQQKKYVDPTIKNNQNQKKKQVQQKQLEQRDRLKQKDNKKKSLESDSNNLQKNKSKQMINSKQNTHIETVSQKKGATKDSIEVNNKIQAQEQRQNLGEQPGKGLNAFVQNQEYIRQKQQINLLKKEEAQQQSAYQDNKGQIQNSRRQNLIERNGQVDLEIRFKIGQVYQILQHLNQSLSTIRNIDAQSHIRNVLDKIQQKVRRAVQ